MSRFRIPTLLALPFAAALIAIPSVALGHAPLSSSTPAAGAKLDSAPSSVTLTFGGDNGGELDPAGSSFTVTDADGSTVGSGKVDLTVANRNVMKAAVTISDPGVYTVTWTSTSSDGATLNGSFSFSYRSDEAIPDPTGGDEHDTPDTSIGAANDPPLMPLGMLLVTTSIALLTRRLNVTAAR